MKKYFFEDRNFLKTEFSKISKLNFLNLNFFWDFFNFVIFSFLKLSVFEKIFFGKIFFMNGLCFIKTMLIRFILPSSDPVPLLGTVLLLPPWFRKSEKFPKSVIFGWFYLILLDFAWFCLILLDFAQISPIFDDFHLTPKWPPLGEGRPSPPNSIAPQNPKNFFGNLKNRCYMSRKPLWVTKSKWDVLGGSQVRYSKVEFFFGKKNSIPAHKWPRPLTLIPLINPIPIVCPPLYQIGTQQGGVFYVGERILRHQKGTQQGGGIFSRRGDIFPKVWVDVWWGPIVLKNEYLQMRKFAINENKILSKNFVWASS